MQIGIVGLGRMGGNMARRLARGGVEVVGFDADRDVVVGAGGGRRARPRRRRSSRSRSR